MELEHTHNEWRANWKRKKKWNWFWLPFDCRLYSPSKRNNFVNCITFSIKTQSNANTINSFLFEKKKRRKGRQRRRRRRVNKIKEAKRNLSLFLSSSIVLSASFCRKIQIVSLWRYDHKEHTQRERLGKMKIYSEIFTEYYMFILIFVIY